MRGAARLGLLAAATALQASQAGGTRTMRQAATVATLAGHAREEAFGRGGAARGRAFRHRLRICNAYPYSSAMDVYRRMGDKLTGEQPMPYGTCRDFVTPLHAGDKIDFKVGDASAGTFSVSDLPNNDALLLLVIHRHDTLTTAVSFESHVFANLLNAQIAVIDTYKGTVHAVPRITDTEQSGESGKARRSEELHFDSVVAVNPGVYEVEVANQDGSKGDKAQLVALNRQSYVVLRMGVEAQQGPSFPPEIVVFPKSSPAGLHHAGAPARGARSALIATLVAAVVAAVNC